MTSAWAVAVQKRAEIAPSLRRQFWLQLRRLLKMFHMLPVVAAVALFGLLAFDGQLKEIYLAYMEEVASAGSFVMLVRFAAAALGFALISAVLYEAHYRLSGPRINVIFSMNSEVGTGSRLDLVQGISAAVIALSPWLGLIAGLLNANVSLNNLFNVLDNAGVEKLDPAALPRLVHIPTPSAWAVAGGIIVLAVVVAWVAALNPKARMLQAAIMVLTPPAAAMIYLLLAGVPSLSIIAAALVATVIYWIVYYRIQMMRAYIFFATALQEDDNFSGTQWQQIILFAWALLPWVFALALYFLLPMFAHDNGQDGGAASSAGTAAFPSLAMIPVAICWVIAIGLAVASSLHSIRDHVAAKVFLYGMVCLVAGLGLLLFWLRTPDQIVTVYRWVGPLGSLAFSLLLLISVFALLALLSQRSSFPALSLSILVIVVSAVLPMSPGWSTIWIAGLCFVVGLIAILARLVPVAAVAAILIAIVVINYSKSREPDLDLYQKANGTDLTQQFSDWLNSRGVPGGKTAGAADSCFAAPTLATAHGAKYPVFIIAAAGGGIYAASAASTLLARLQDENPCFSDHVFAISGVSGGAIGAAIFQAIEKARLTAAPTGTSPLTLARVANAAAAAPPSQDLTDECQPPPPMGTSTVTDVSFEREVCKIIEADNFSPLVAAIFPELLGFNSKGRAAELAASFQNSANKVDSGAGTVLSAAFANDWSDTSKAPALALNATWVETGLRAAIAPFPLHKIDDSLYSFVDECMPKTSQSLLQAAVVSARFPFILPPYTVQVTPLTGQTDCGQAASGDPRELHWNFVDGGYSDSSGAATALALYRALLGTAQKRQVQLELVLLTSSDPKLEANKVTGTTFADIMGPLDAMLSVRAGLANEAVARACDGVFTPAQGSNGSAETQNTCDDRANQADSPLQLVGIEDETYGLSLGWKISQTTFSVVSWMLGQPDDVSDTDCNTSVKPSTTNTQSSGGHVVLNEATVKRNSCVLRFIRQSLGGATASGAAPNGSLPAH